jgi:hypothetical protein
VTLFGQAAFAADMTAPRFAAANVNTPIYTRAQAAWKLPDAMHAGFAGQPSPTMGIPGAGQPSASYHSGR